MPQEVPSKLTPVAPLEAATAILKLGPDILGPLSRESARMLLAHLWFETGQGKTLWNYNPGNVMAAHIVNGREVFIRADADYRRPSWYLDTSNPYHAAMMKGREPSAFLALSSLDDGIRSYLENVSRKDGMTGPMARSDVSAFSRGIRQSGYCPSCEDGTLEKAITQYIKEFEQAGYFSSLPSVPYKAPAMSMQLGVAAVVGFIFWGTLKARKQSP